LPKVPIESPVLRRSLGKSFHKCGPATANDCSWNVLLQHGTVPRQCRDDLSVCRPELATSCQSSNCTVPTTVCCCSRAVLVICS